MATVPVRQIWTRGMLRLGAALLSFALTAPLALAERMALVVGNGDYSTAPDLANSVGDAKAIAKALKGLDFKVTLITDADGAQLQPKLDAFVTEAETADSVVFYYSGHAFQMGGVNYLVPVDARLESRDGVKAESWSLDGIIARLQSRSHQTLIFLDACRNDPLPASVRGSGASADGLARVQTGVGTFVAFATEPGGVTADGVQDAKNSPFTAALLKHIQQPGKSISDMMIEVRNDVENATLRKQVPWDQSSLREQFYFVPPASSGKQVLSEADYELLAELSPADRKQFLDLLAQSGFDEGSLKEAEAEISLAEANLEQVAGETTIIGAAEPEIGAPEPAAGPEPEPQATAEPEAPGLDDLAVVDDMSIGEAPTETEIAELDPALEPKNPELGEEAPIRLAALDWNTRGIGLNEDKDGLRLVGKAVTADTDEGRAILAAIDPRLLDSDAVVAIDEGGLAKGVQGELKRVGCYQMGVDGSWGKGSRTALTSYYLAKKIVPSSLEPTVGLFDQLSAEPTVVCQARVAKSAVKTGNRARVETAAAEPAATTRQQRLTTKTGKKQQTGKTRITNSTLGAGNF